MAMTEEHNFCSPGKMAWPELVGMDGEKAADIIEEENKNVDAVVVRDGTIVTMDFRCDRVWVWVNKDNRVVRPPFVG